LDFAVAGKRPHRRDDRRRWIGRKKGLLDLFQSEFKALVVLGLADAVGEDAEA